MPDNKNKQGTADDIRVDANDPSEVEYLHQQFPNKSHEEIKQAIAAAGPLRADIIAYLRGR
jgi:hypothetical protein